MRMLRLRGRARLRMAVEVRNEMRIVHQAQKEKDMTQDERIAVIIGEIILDIEEYIDELLHDRLHDCWEQWTLRMDEISDDLRALNDNIGKLEDSSKQRMLDKKLKEIDPEREYPSRVTALMGDTDTQKRTKK